MGRGKPCRVRFKQGGLSSPRSSRSRAATTIGRRRRLPSPSTSTRSVALVFGECAIATAMRVARLSQSLPSLSDPIGLCVLCLANAQSRLRGEWQGSRRRHHHYPIPLVRGVDSWTQQQHHEYAYDTCCLLSMLLCLMRVLCLVLLQ